MRYVQNSYAWGRVLKTAGYTFFLLMIQTQWVARASYVGLRVDLLLPLMFGVALREPPVVGIFWAFLWGYVADVLSGKFWGFHVLSYVAAACLVNLGSQKIEFHNPVYQVLFVGLCSLGQSAVLGLFLWADPSWIGFMPASVWNSLGLRSIVMALLAPLIIYPISEGRRAVI